MALCNLWVSGERPNIVCSVIFKYTDWQAYSPFLEETEGLFGLKSSSGIESNLDHLYVCLEGLPQISARTLLWTTHIIHNYHKAKAKISQTWEFCRPSGLSATASPASVSFKLGTWSFLLNLQHIIWSCTFSELSHHQLWCSSEGGYFNWKIKGTKGHSLSGHFLTS